MESVRRETRKSLGFIEADIGGHNKRARDLGLLFKTSR